MADAGFKNFGDLPLEVQLKVWKEFIAINHCPQALILYMDQNNHSVLRIYRPCNIFWRAAYGTTSALRKEATNDLTLCFAERLKKPILFDPKVDFLFFANYETSLSFFQTHTRDVQNPNLQNYGIKNLAIDGICPTFKNGTPGTSDQDVRNLYKLVRIFRSVNDLYIVAPEEYKESEEYLRTSLDIMYRRYTEIWE